MELKAHELYKKIILSLSKVQLNREKLFSKYFSASILAHRNRLTVASFPIDF